MRIVIILVYRFENPAAEGIVFFEVAPEATFGEVVAEHIFVEVAFFNTTTNRDCDTPPYLIGRYGNGSLHDFAEGFRLVDGLLDFFGRGLLVEHFL